jgi:hypothetical protein
MKAAGILMRFLLDGILLLQMNKILKENSKGPSITVLVTMQSPKYAQALQRPEILYFLLCQVKRQDVWIVTNYEAIQWMRNPTPLTKMETFNPWKTCETPIPIEKQACNIPRYIIT